VVTLFLGSLGIAFAFLTLLTFFAGLIVAIDYLLTFVVITTDVVVGLFGVGNRIRRGVLTAGIVRENIAKGHGLLSKLKL
jgi:hypothetical protein